MFESQRDQRKRWRGDVQTRGSLERWGKDTESGHSVCRGSSRTMRAAESQPSGHSTGKPTPSGRHTQEGEAVCAALNASGAVDGVTTEDSDAFVCGATSVYRGLSVVGTRGCTAKRYDIEQHHVTHCVRNEDLRRDLPKKTHAPRDASETRENRNDARKTKNDSPERFGVFRRHYHHHKGRGKGEAEVHSFCERSI